jgi:O-antigen/teichoic acid export membrane protein
MGAAWPLSLEPPAPESRDDRHADTVRAALTRNLGPDIAARVGYLVSRVFIPPFVLARLGLEMYGLWSTAFILVSYLGISTFGISSVYVKYVAEYAARGDTRKANSLLSTGMVITTAGCVILFAALWLGWPRVQHWLNIPAHLQHTAHDVIMLVVAVFLCDIAASVFRDAMSGVQKIAEIQAIWVICYVVEAALIFYLVGTGHGILGLAEAFMLRTLLSILLSAMLAYRMLPWLRISPLLCTRESIRALLGFGGIVQLGALIAIGLNTVERVIAAPLIGLSAVGLLDLSDKLPQMASSIPFAFAGAFLPAASYINGADHGTPAERRQVIVKLYLKGARYMNLASATLAGLLAAASGPILAVWMGKVYPGTAFLMSIFAIQQQIHLLTGPGTSILKGIGRPREEFFYSVPNVIALAAAVPLSRLILGHWSVVGLGVAVVVATVVSALGFVIHANRILDIPWRRYVRFVLMPGTLPYLVGAVASVPAWILIPHLGRWQGAGVIGAIGLLYSAALVILADRIILETDERQWFRAVIRQRLARLLPAAPCGANP